MVSSQVNLRSDLTKALFLQGPKCVDMATAAAAAATLCLGCHDSLECGVNDEPSSTGDGHHDTQHSNHEHSERDEPATLR